MFPVRMSASRFGLSDSEPARSYHSPSRFVKPVTLAFQTSEGWGRA